MWLLQIGLGLHAIAMTGLWRAITSLAHMACTTFSHSKCPFCRHLQYHHSLYLPIQIPLVH